MVGCFLSQVFQAVPALYLVAKQHPVKMAAKKAASSLFSPSTEEEAERESLTVSNTVQVLDFEDERYAATVTMSQQLQKIPLPKIAAKARPKGRPSAPKEKASSSNSPKVKAMPKKRVVLKRKSASDAVASEVLRRGAGDQREACSAEALQGQDSCQALCQAGRARDVQCPGEGHGPQVCSLRATEALALGSFRMSSPSLRDRSGGDETCQLQSCGGLGGGMQRGQLHHHYPRGEDDGHHRVEDGRVWDERGSTRRERQSLSLQNPGAPKGSSKEEATHSAKATSGRSTDGPTTCTEDINHSEDARNSQQGPIASGSSGDRVACFVAVPRHGLKRQGTRNWKSLRMYSNSRCTSSS